MIKKNAIRNQRAQEAREAQLRYEDGRKRRKTIMRAVIGLILAVSILLPLVMVSINALSAGQVNEANSTSSSIDPTKLTKSERKELLKSYTGSLTEEQKKEFIETGSISGATTSTATPSEQVTSSPSTSTTSK